MSTVDFTQAATDFLHFLQTATGSDATENSGGKASAIVVTPWLYTAVPFYSIALALFYKHQGCNVVIIWDDLSFADKHQSDEQNQVIGTVLGSLSDSIEIIKASKLPSLPLFNEDHAEITKLARLNTVWMHKSSVFSNESAAYETSCREALTAALVKIKFLFDCDKFDHFVVPGGIYGTSGLYSWEGRRCNVRVSTFDCWVGHLLLGVNGAAAHLMDIPTLYKQGCETLWSDTRLASQAIELAKNELSARMESRDDETFQTVAFSSSQTLGPFDVLMPLNIEWDSAALGKHQFFETSLDWLTSTINFLLDETTANIAVRQHPSERLFGSGHHLKDALTGQFGSNPRFRFFASDEEVNTYKLLEHTRVVLPHTSTIGVESAALGKVVIVESSSYYSELAFVTKATSRAHYFSLIKQALQTDVPQAPSRQDDALFCYFLTQIANQIHTDFTPQPNDYAKWVTQDFNKLVSDETIKMIVKSFSEGIPAAALRYENILNESLLEHPAISPAGRPRAEVIRQEPPQAGSSDISGECRLETHFPEVSFGDHVQVLGVKNITIGKGSCIGDNTWLNICIRDESVRMRIGDCVLVGRQGMISTGGYLEIGDYCVFAPRVYISDADHIFTDIMQPILQQGATINRSVVVEENCWLGINTVISGNITIGRGSVIGANAVVTRDVHPFSVMAGNPGQIIKMYSPRSGTWERTRSKDDIQRILEERIKIGIPSREEYQRILKQNANFSRLDPVLTGRGNL
jgi:acetyltransferase-like isoleucine patch superfamily enzyme